MKILFKKIMVVLFTTIFLSGCVLVEKIVDNKETAIGCTVGAGLGALLGDKFFGSDGRKFGFALGTIIGCTLGKQLQERRETLEILAQQEKFDIEVKDIVESKHKETKKTELLINKEPQDYQGNNNAVHQVVGMAATVSGHEEESMFKSGSVTPTDKGRQAFEKLAELYKDSNQNILITGHTDSGGTETLNQELSEKRAKYVADLFKRKGVPVERLFYQGAGESQPITSNSTSMGRAKNRRVEIIEIDGIPDRLLAYSHKQQTNIEYLARRSQDKIEKSDKIRTQKSGKQEPARTQLPTEDIKITAITNDIKVKSKSTEIDFGGSPMLNASSNFSKLIGQKKSGTNSLLSNAYADESLCLNCIAEGPRVSGTVKSLATGRPYNRDDYETADYFPGMYGTHWVHKTNGNYVVLYPVAVLEKSGKSITNPRIRIWKNYSGNSKAQPDFNLSTTVETYIGDKGMLYRVFNSEDTSVLRCMDLVMPLKNSNIALDGSLFYDKNNKVYQATYKPQMLR